MSQRTEIIVFGSLNIDLITVTPRVPVAGETLTSTSFSTAPGGKGLNQCLSAQRSSRSSRGSSSPRAISVRMFGAVGDDEFGPKLLSVLRDDGVDVDAVRTVEKTSSGVAVILVEESGMNRIMVIPGANGTLKWPGLSPAEWEKVGMLIVQLETPLPEVLAAIREASNHGVDVLFNPAPARTDIPRDMYPHVRYLVVNETEAAILAGVDVSALDSNPGIVAAANTLRGFGARNVIVTLGSRGAYYLAEDAGSGFVPAVKVARVVDTTGAGDTWVGAFAVEMLGAEKVDGEVLGKAVGFAGRAAGVAVTREGATGGIPWRGEVPEEA